ncbi:LOW QUALITY PROTEIN: multiple myeloma tumor-associated protein 2 homolog [Phoenix dactylifera]|uniref:LOW QUALITY PROTEIN: multiple myeloma tumor-associated protein 2 homolog n=1 Tax=Phoenix dactylifera TaxID=42345 RepID=A0A8B7C0A4_PHODC|nr:LOW QUALITY PROTEIN: multiple myeloma tumor-associated protein 2 homolog [Phoenix dactylifera]
MYHPSRGGVRGGRDQFKWDDVKVDKHRENYVGHSVKAPVGRWQKGKDLFWYARDKKAEAAETEAVKEEIRRIKEEEEQAMREALGLAPKRANRPQGNRLDKNEYAELVKRGSTAEDLGAGHAEAAQVQGLGLYKLPSNPTESSFLPGTLKEIAPDREDEAADARNDEEETEEERRKKRRHEERREGKEKRREKHKKKRSDEHDDKRKHRREKEKRRHDSD